MKIILAVVLTFTLAACTDDGPASDEAVLQDIVVIDEITSQSTTFAVSLPGSDKVAFLKTGKVLSGDDAEPGKCCLIRYTTPAEPYTSADIDLLGCYAVPNLEASVAVPEEIAGYSDTPVYLISAWSFCNRVIFRMELPYPANDRRLMLLLNPETAGESVPEFRLIQDMPESADKSYMKSYIVAFSLDQINEKKDWKGVKICLNNSNLKENVVTLNMLNE
ncbi:MAG: hypothetical protein K2M07_06240 [Muribaculaceae bacterium]|nr:hypothetical protein [Muribaculaceae bacterium]